MMSAKPVPFRLPKRLTRARRISETKRLKKTIAKENVLIEDFAEKLRYYWDNDDDDEVVIIS
jgi:hypothetical protein